MAVARSLQPLRMLPAYAELHCLSNFSFLRGASHPEELVERAQALGYAALAITDECSLAGVVRAHLAAKTAGLKLCIGSELTLVDGTKLVLLATDRTSYGNLAQLVTRGRRQAKKGSYALSRDDVAEFAGRLLALWVPEADSGTTSHAASAPEKTLLTARWVDATFPGRAWIAVELFARAGERARLARCAELSRTTGLPQVAAGDVHMHARARRALQDTLTAIRLRTPIAECGYALHPNGERHLRSRARLATIYPSALLAETVAIAERCTFSLDELRYEYPEEIVPPGATPASHLRALTEAGLARRYPDAGVPEDVRGLIEHELALIAELRYEPYFLTVHDIVAFARSRGDPLPGPRLGGQLGGLLRARHHRGRSRADVDAVRALHQQGAQRAARHRRRLRAPAARGSDAVRLREVRPGPRRAGGDAHHLPAEERGARRRQGARSRPRAGRSAGRRVLLVGRPRRQGGTDPRGRIRCPTTR